MGIIRVKGRVWGGGGKRSKVPRPCMVLLHDPCKMVESPPPFPPSLFFFRVEDHVFSKQVDQPLRFCRLVKSDSRSPGGSWRWQGAWARTAPSCSRRCASAWERTREPRERPLSHLLEKGGKFHPDLCLAFLFSPFFFVWLHLICLDLRTWQAKSLGTCWPIREVSRVPPSTRTSGD